MSKTTKPMTEQILDWFEHNPGAKMRSGPLAKALKADATKTAEALGRLTNGGQLDRVRVMVPANERGRAAAEQWEYWLPLGGKVVPAPKPYQPPKAFRRDTPAVTTTPAEPLATVAAQISATEAHAPAPASVPDDELRRIKAELETARQELADSRAETDLVKVDMAQKLADSDARIVELEAALAAANSWSYGELAGYVVATPNKPLRRAKLEKTALQHAMSAARANGVAEVYAIFPAGKAVRGAQWRPTSWPTR